MYSIVIFYISIRSSMNRGNPVEDLRRQLHSVKEQLEEKTRFVGELTSVVPKLNESLANLERKYNGLDEMYRNSQLENEHLKASLGTMEREFEDSKIQIQCLNDSLCTMLEENARLEQDVATKEETIGLHEQERIELLEKLRVVNTKFEQQNGYILQLEKDKETARQTIQLERVQKAQVEDNLRLMSLKYQKLEEACVDKDKEIGALKVRIQPLQEFFDVNSKVRGGESDGSVFSFAGVASTLSSVFRAVSPGRPRAEQVTRGRSPAPCRFQEIPCNSDDKVPEAKDVMVIRRREVISQRPVASLDLAPRMAKTFTCDTEQQQFDSWVVSDPKACEKYRSILRHVSYNQPLRVPPVKFCVMARCGMEKNPGCVKNMDSVKSLIDGFQVKDFMKLYNGSEEFKAGSPNYLKALASVLLRSNHLLVTDLVTMMKQAREEGKLRFEDWEYNPSPLVSSADGSGDEETGPVVNCGPFKVAGRLASVPSASLEEGDGVGFDPAPESTRLVPGSGEDLGIVDFEEDLT